VGFYFGKNSSIICLTKFDNNYNHQCDPITIDLASKNSRFSIIILNKIKYYTINDHLDVRQQYDLLIKEFPKHSIKKKIYIILFKIFEIFEFIINLIQL